MGETHFQVGVTSWGLSLPPGCRMQEVPAGPKGCDLAEATSGTRARLCITPISDYRDII